LGRVAKKGLYPSAETHPKSKAVLKAVGAVLIARGVGERHAAMKIKKQKNG